MLSINKEVANSDVQSCRGARATGRDNATPPSHGMERCADPAIIVVCAIRGFSIKFHMWPLCLVQYLGEQEILI